jgi:hypothetical protein
MTGAHASGTQAGLGSNLAVRAGRARTDAASLDGTIEWDPFAGVSMAANRIAIDPAGTARDRIVAGRFRVKTLLGTGGMGAVWLAQD